MPVDLEFVKIDVDATVNLHEDRVWLGLVARVLLVALSWKIPSLAGQIKAF